MNINPTQRDRTKQEVRFCVSKRLPLNEPGNYEQTRTAFNMAERIQQQTGINPDEAARVAVDYSLTFVK